MTEGNAVEGMFPSHPFANGSEGHAWMNVWCAHCTRDHGIHSDTGPGCSLIANAMMHEDDRPGGEAWIAEPTGTFHLPSLMVCLAFEPCTQGDCQGDPKAEVRANVRAHTLGYWAEQR